MDHEFLLECSKVSQSQALSDFGVEKAVRLTSDCRLIKEAKLQKCVYYQMKKITYQTFFPS